MSRVLVGLWLLACFFIQPANAAEQKAFFSCSAFGKSDRLQEHETGPALLFSIAVSGLDQRATAKPINIPIKVEMVIDNHKVLNGGYFQTGLTAPEGYVLASKYPNGQMMMAAFFPLPNSPYYQLNLTGLEKDQKTQWAFFDGVCKVDFRIDDVIPERFMDAMYPMMENKASEAYNVSTDKQKKQ